MSIETETENLKGLCIECQQPFKFGTNVFTKEGLAETRISGMCEKCCDALFEEDDDDKYP